MNLFNILQIVSHLVQHLPDVFIHIIMPPDRLIEFTGRSDQRLHLESGMDFNPLDILFFSGIFHRQIQQVFLESHPDLYLKDGDLVRLRVEGGQIQIGSLDCPGYAVARFCDDEQVLQ